MYLGRGKDGSLLFTPAESGLLVLGPPRSGKSAAIVVPNVLGATGPVVSTSTKTDVMEATSGCRARQGDCLLYDPSGSVDAPRGVRRVTWSPVSAASSWDGALEVTRALVRSAHGMVGPDSRHWSERAEALLAPLFHAAWLAGEGPERVSEWVHRHHVADSQDVLHANGADFAAGVLDGIAATDERERSGIFSTAAGVLAAYRSEGARSSSSDSEVSRFDPAVFVSGGDTLYVCAPATSQSLTAPLVSGLVDRIRAATYAVHGSGTRTDGKPPARPRPAVLLALDEVANIAPLPDLPAVASEGGGQGLVTLACLQDLSQARSRWGDQASGFMSLFGAKLFLPGIADVQTLEAVSTLIGDRQVALHSRTRGRGRSGWSSSSGSTTGFRRRMPPDLLSRGRPGSALWLQGGEQPRSVRLTPWYSASPWRELAAAGAPPPS
ncbi:MAG: TraM recognition domain-containing protein [Actinomycetota bacterium]|nr:TraM recognition domain-containing protein [Actinomycetota bacterium]